MINNQLAKTLNFPGLWQSYYIQNPSFFNNAHIWNRCQKNSNIHFSNMPKFQYFKVGKTFGLEVVRYLTYQNGVLCYYQNKNDKQPRAFCLIENLYMYYFPSGNHYVLHLTNGADYISIFLNDHSFIKNYGSQILHQVIQMNLRASYTIGQQIGQGTFSKVYAAHNLVTKQKVALKIVPKINEMEQFDTRYIIVQQKRILTMLDSKLTNKMQAFFQDNQNYIFVLQFLSGKDLSIHLKQKRQMPLNQVTYILKQILKALIQIHQKNIIHRDLKPHNIIYDPLIQEVKLIDFGLSLVYNQHTDLEKFMRCGTMGYIAPEIANNLQACRKRYDTQSDMFGFGIIAHMLLFGYNPLRGKTYKQTCERNMLGEVNLDHQNILQLYGQNCLHFLSSLVHKDPKSRPTAYQALIHPFLNQVYSPSARNSFLGQIKEIGHHHNDEVNCIEDKQLGVNNNKNKINSSSLEKEEIVSPTKSSWKSKSRSFGLGIV